MTLLLNDASLSRFEAALRAVGAPVLEALAPGLTDEQLDAARGETDIRLPEEARVWWRWRDGTRADADPANILIVPRRVPLAFGNAVEVFQSVAADLTEWGQGWQVERQLLNLVSEKPYIYIECARPTDAPVPIWTEWHEEVAERRLPSIGELVDCWCWLIEERVWNIADDGSWTVAKERIPPDWTEMGIA